MPGQPPWGGSKRPKASASLLRSRAGPRGGAPARAFFRPGGKAGGMSLLRRRAFVRPGPHQARRAGRAPWGWALAGALAGGALALALGAPARWLAAALAWGSGGMVQLGDAQGSLWNGSARLALTGGAGSRDRVALPGRVQWQLRPQWGGLHMQLRADCCTPGQPLALLLRPQWGGAQLAVADGQSVWPAAVLTGLGTPWNTVQPQGELGLSTQGLRATWAQARLQLQGSAEITARHMASRLSTLQPIGSYRARIEGGDTVRLSLQTLEGKLLLSGSGQWVGQRLRFSGEARAAEGLQTQLSNLLNIIGPRQGDRAIISLGQG